MDLFSSDVCCGPLQHLGEDGRFQCVHGSLADAPAHVERASDLAAGLAEAKGEQ